MKTYVFRQSCLFCGKTYCKGKCLIYRKKFPPPKINSWYRIPCSGKTIFLKSRLY